MADKAVLCNVTNLNFDGTDYQLTALFVVTNGANAQIAIGSTASASSLNPLLPNWKSRLKTQIIADAATQGITVDQVLFPDFTLL